jgi:hypothetical protein
MLGITVLAVDSARMRGLSWTVPSTASRPRARVQHDHVARIMRCGFLMSSLFMFHSSGQRQGESVKRCAIDQRVSPGTTV